MVEEIETKIPLQILTFGLVTGGFLAMTADASTEMSEQASL